MEKSFGFVLLLAGAGCLGEPPSEVNYGRVGEGGYGLSDDNPIVFTAFAVDPADPGFEYSPEITWAVLEEGLPLVPPQEASEVGFGLQVQPLGPPSTSGILPVLAVAAGGAIVMRVSMDPALVTRGLQVGGALVGLIIVATGAERLIEKIRRAQVPGVTVAATVEVVAPDRTTSRVIATDMVDKTWQPPGCLSTGLSPIGVATAPVTLFTVMDVGPDVCVFPRIVLAPTSSAAFALNNRTPRTGLLSFPTAGPNAFAMAGPGAVSAAVPVVTAGPTLGMVTAGAPRPVLLVP